MSDRYTLTGQPGSQQIKDTQTGETLHPQDLVAMLNNSGLKQGWKAVPVPPTPTMKKAGALASHSAHQRLIQWLLSDDTGESSIAIAKCLAGIDDLEETEYARLATPMDVYDFGRCYRLLKLIPEFRSRIHELGERSAQWAALVDSWEELEGLYASDRKTCRQRIREIRKAVPEPGEISLSDGLTLRL